MEEANTKSISVNGTCTFPYIPDRINIAQHIKNVTTPIKKYIMPNPNTPTYIDPEIPKDVFNTNATINKKKK